MREHDSEGIRGGARHQGLTSLILTEALTGVEVATGHVMTLIGENNVTDVMGKPLEHLD